MAKAGFTWMQEQIINKIKKCKDSLDSTEVGKEFVTPMYANTQEAQTGARVTRDSVTFAKRIG